MIIARLAGSLLVGSRGGLWKVSGRSRRDRAASAEAARGTQPPSDVDPLVPHLLEFINAEIWSGKRRFLEAHLELLSERADTLLNEFVDALRRTGDQQIANGVEAHRLLLQRCQQIGIGAAFHELTGEAEAEFGSDLAPLLERLTLGRERYEETGDMQALSMAAAAAEELLDHPALTGSPAGSQMVACNEAGVVLGLHYRAFGQRTDLQASTEAFERAVAAAPANDPRLPTVVGSLARSRLDCYERGGALADLQTAIDRYEQVLAVAPDDHPHRPGWLNDLGGCLLSRYRRAGQLTDLRRAIDFYEQALAATPDDHPHRPGLLSNFGNSLRDQYEHGGQLADLQAAIDRYEQALGATPDDHPHRPGRLSNLGSGLISRYERGGQLADLQRAIDLYEQALAATPDDDPDLPSRLSNLGSALLSRYERTGQLTDLDTAIDLHERAVAAIPDDHPDLPMQLNNLGISLHYRYERGGQLTDLQAAIDLLEQAVGAIPDGHPELPERLSNLGYALHDRFDRGGQLTDLDAAIDLYEQAVAATPEGHPRLADLVTNLGNGLHARFEHGKALADLQAAIDRYEQALAATPDGDPHKPRLLSNLGISLHDLHVQRGQPLAPVATAAFRESCVEGLKTNLAATLNSASRWSLWAVRQGAWAAAIEACDFGLAAADQLVQVQLARGHKEAWLREARDLPGRAAYARARRDDGKGAVVALERGRAVLLAEAMERDRADLERLTVLGRADLAERYRRAAGLVRQLERTGERSEPTMPVGAADRRQVRDELEDAIATIREIEGYEGFLRPPTFEQIAAAAAAAPLVYLLAVEPGGIGLTVWRDGSVMVTLLPKLRWEMLRDHVREYMETYRRKQADPAAWRVALEETTGWLWDAAMGPLLAAHSQATRLVLIPTGLLGLLPLHAAWTRDPTTPTGRRYVLDQLTVSYTPNARALREAQRTAARVAGDALLAVDDPRPVSAEPLPNSAPEVQAARNAFPASRVLRHGEATREMVLATLAHYPVLHLSCHGYANLVEPLNSGLVMANDEPLTLRDLIQQQLVGTRLVVLSACETAIPGTELLDEVTSLASGLLQTGAGGVIGSLWSVPDLSTMALLTRFYALWRDQDVDPAEALRRAQQWLRDSTFADLADAIPGIAAFTRPEAADWRPFASTFHWGGFAFAGA